MNGKDKAKELNRTTFQTAILMMAHTEIGKLEHLQKYKEKGILEHIKIWIMSR
jgi:hypothetical protein